MRDAWRITFPRSIPDDVADAVLYLARARNGTGQMIAVDGGQPLAWKTPDVMLKSWPGLLILSLFHSPQPLAFSEMIRNRHEFWLKPRPDKEDEFLISNVA